VVLAPDRVAPERLSGTAAVIWELLDEPLDPDELGDGVALVVGRPADVATSLDLLVEARLVASRPDG